MKTKTKTYHVMNSEDVHTYDIEVKELKDKVLFQMNRSNNDCWTEPREHCMTIIEHSDLTITLPELDQRVENYQAGELTVLLKFAAKYGLSRKMQSQADFIVIEAKGIKI